MARICLLTERDFARHVFRAGFYECQDVLAEMEDVDLISIQPAFSYELRQRWHDKLIWHDFTGLAYRANIAFQPVTLKRDYELFVAHFSYMKDISHVSAVRNWKQRCKRSVIWIDEWWAKDILSHKRWLRGLSEFDYLICGYSQTAKLASDVLGRECHFVPGGVDALRFSPYPTSPDRVIDVLSIGRRFAGLHQVLINKAKETNLFYVHDTFGASDAQTYDYRQHREMYANMAKRSRFSLVAPGLPGKPDNPGETKGQIHVGLRYYEAAAAGTIMLGPIPNSDTFRTMFDWPDAVIEVRPDGSDVADKIDGLIAKPQRLLEVSQRNATEALLRHDWVYRWRKVFDIMGMTPGPGTAVREDRLRQLAKEFVTR